MGRLRIEIYPYLDTSAVLNKLNDARAVAE
jgi:hypothetical protein